MNKFGLVFSVVLLAYTMAFATSLAQQTTPAVPSVHDTSDAASDSKKARERTCFVAMDLLVRERAPTWEERWRNPSRCLPRVRGDSSIGDTIRIFEERRALVPFVQMNWYRVARVASIRGTIRGARVEGWACCPWLLCGLCK